MDYRKQICLRKKKKEKEEEDEEIPRRAALPIRL